MAELYDKHLQYIKFEEQWKRIRDVVEGSDKVKREGTLYLPKLSGQTEDEYESYKLRANFLNLTARIINTNTGLMFSKQPTIDLPKSIAYLYDDTETFTSIYELFYTSTREVLTMGRFGIMLDIDTDKAGNDIIIPVMYVTEDIVYWQTVDGELTRLVLKEIQIVDGTEEVEFVMDYSLVIVDNELVCKVEKTNTSTDEVSVIYPSFRGRSISMIPFCCVNTTGLNFTPVKSPVLDIVDLNLSHYRSSADYEHGLHFVAMPTPVLTGASDISKIKIGASAILLPDPNSKAFYLEFLGQGLNALEKALSNKQSQMSMFSARIQDTSTKGSESENIVKLRYSTDTATLHDIAIVVELLITKSCEMMLEWMGKGTEGLLIELDKNFIDSKLTHQELATLSDCLIKGTIDEATYVYNLRRGQVVEEGHNLKLNYKLEAEEDKGNEDEGGIGDKTGAIGDNTKEGDKGLEE
jgi:hypothetical protein